jgi:hypothetical protein
MTADTEERKCELGHLNMHALTNGDARMFKLPQNSLVTRGRPVAPVLSRSTS